MIASFAAIFFSEWGDIGQVTAATLAARFGSPVVVWVGAVGAMVTKGALAAYAGAGVRQWIQEHVSPKTVRYVAVGLLLLLGLLSVAETLSNPRIAPAPVHREIAVGFAQAPVRQS
jgi:putative Ca2+/H+ antiporter (TMEM165/GDT1 family)